MTLAAYLMRIQSIRLLLCKLWGTHLGCSNQDLAILGCAEVVHHAHEVDGLCSSLFCLGYVQVHLIPVKVSIVWRAHALIESECPAHSP